MTEDLLNYARAMRAQIVAGEGFAFSADDAVRLRDFFASVEEILDQHQDQCVRLNEQLRAELIDSDKARSRAEAQVEEMAMRRMESAEGDRSSIEVAWMALEIFLKHPAAVVTLNSAVQMAVAIFGRTRRELNLTDGSSQ